MGAEQKLYLLNTESKDQLWSIIDHYYYYKSKSLASNSQKAYGQCLSFLKRHCGSFADLNRSHLNQIINAEGSLRTKTLRKSVIDDFISWCKKESYIETSPEIEVYRTRRQHNESSILTISENQLRVLLAGVDDGRIRDILLVGFYMGLRISEIVHCRPAWVIEDDKFLRIGDLRIWKLDNEFHPKSQKEYDTPVAIPSKVRRVFDRQQYGDPYRRMFGFESESTLRYHLRPVFGSLPAPLSHHFSAHHLRHSCISYWLNERRVSVQEVQRLARHSRMETTMKYYHPDDQAHLRTFTE